MNLALNKLSQVAINLENHEEAARVKKMLYCLVKDVWENDPAILDRHPVEELLKEVVQNTPDINRVLSSLIRIVKNLNRQELYAPLVKDIVIALIPVYNMDVNKINQIELQKLINKAQGFKNKENFVCFNLMEFLVKEEAYREMQKLPVNMAKFIGFAEVCTYALNRLPAMYVSSEEGKQYQLKKAEEIKDKIHAAVLQGIAAIRRDPLRKSTPLDLYEIDAHTAFAGFVLELEKLLPVKDADDGTKVPVKELSDKAIDTIRVYQASLQEMEEFLQSRKLTNSKITAINLVPTIKKIINQILANSSHQASNASLPPSILKEIEDFLGAEKLSYSKLTTDNLVSTLKKIIYQLLSQINASSSQSTASVAQTLASSPLKQKIIDLLNTYDSLIAHSPTSGAASIPVCETTMDILDAHEQMIASFSAPAEDSSNVQTALSSNYSASDDLSSEAAILDILDAHEQMIARLGEANSKEDLADSSETQFMTVRDIEQRKQQQRNVHQTMIINFDEVRNEESDRVADLDDWYSV